jgi:hypothetical protein
MNLQDCEPSIAKQNCLRPHLIDELNKKLQFVFISITRSMDGRQPESGCKHLSP